jgi:two-component system sensor histidine kinase KdpD
VTGDNRPNPDALLAAIQSNAARQERGRLKVFLGMSPGVGKTYAMLEAARRESAAKRDVVIGYVETHGRKETDELTVGIPTVPRKTVEHRGITLTEMDLDAVLARRPQLALVDELAHTNAPGSRHPKRWQDVQELLDAGIDVFTTLNVQHIESRADTVRQITGTEIKETVPDSVLDDAVLELVDLPPTELRQRLEEGKVYLPDRAAAAAQNFFREQNLTALREIALRLVADHVGVDTGEFYREQTRSSPWKTSHRLLVAVGPGPLSEPLIRWTRRMADGLKCRWLAVHVEGPQSLTPAAQVQLERNLATARELGAEVITTTDDDLVRGLLRVAREQNVTQIVVGKPGGGGWWEWLHGGRLMRRLARASGDIDLHVVRAEKAFSGRPSSLWQPVLESHLRQYLFAVGTIAVTGVLNWGLTTLAGPRVPGLVFLLAVMLLALKVGRGPVLVAGALSALVWNFFFLPPRFTFYITNLEDGMLFGTYFVVALILGQLVARIRTQEQAERRREERTSALYELTRDLAEAGSRDEVVWQLIAQITRVFAAPIAVCLVKGDKLDPHPDSSLILTEKELSVADWAYRQRKAAGRFTDNLPGADALHLPLATERRTFGVLAVGVKENLNTGQRDLLETFARQAALVLDRVELRNAAEQARLLAESDRLSQTLLNSISHELRTPLAASSSAVSALAAAYPEMPEHCGMLLGEIQEANTRLNRIVGNLLDVARLESGKIQLRLDWHDARDLVHTTVRELHRELANRPVEVNAPAEAMLVKLDVSLVQHALANLLLNAAMHTPPGPPIEVTARFSEQNLLLSVADRGPGIPPEMMPRIFDKFFRAPGAVTGGSGLGLTIARGFVEAHGGAITAENRPGGGAIFTLRLPQLEKPPQTEPNR